ncbi:MAG: GFA family protein [Cellvibrionaceae bacterium]
MFEASCHCGNIVLKASEAPNTITSCNCSICHRLGALWAYYAKAQVDIFMQQAGQEYSWGSQKLTFHRCENCGCCTHYSALKDDGSNRIAINTRMVLSSKMHGIPVRHFDGADTWKYLDE